MCVCVCVRVFVHARVRVCVCVFLCAPYHRLGVTKETPHDWAQSIKASTQHDAVLSGGTGLGLALSPSLSLSLPLLPSISGFFNILTG